MFERAKRAWSILTSGRREDLPEPEHVAARPAAAADPRPQPTFRTERPIRVPAGGSFLIKAPAPGAFYSEILVFDGPDGTGNLVDRIPAMWDLPGSEPAAE